MGCGSSKPSPVYDDLQATASQATIDDAQSEQQNHATGSASVHATISITNESNPSDGEQGSSAQHGDENKAAVAPLRLLAAGSSGPAGVFSAALSELTGQNSQHSGHSKHSDQILEGNTDSMQAVSLGDADPTPNLSLVAPAAGSTARSVLGEAVQPDGTAHAWKALYGQAADTDCRHAHQGMLDISSAASVWPQHLPLSHILSFGPADAASARVRLRAVARWAESGNTDSSEPPADCSWELAMDLYVYMGVPASSAVFQALLPHAIRHMESSTGAGDFCRAVSARLQHATQFPTAFISCPGVGSSPLAGLVSFFECVLASSAMAQSTRTLPAAVLVVLLQACGKEAMAPAGHPLNAELSQEDSDDEMAAWGVALRSAKWMAPPATLSSGDVVAGAGEVLLAGAQLAVASGNVAILHDLLSVVGVNTSGGLHALLDCPRDIQLALQAASLVDIAALHAQRAMFHTLTDVDGALRLVPWQWGSRSVLCAAASGSASMLVDLLSWESMERLAANNRTPSRSGTSNSEASSRVSNLSLGAQLPGGPAVNRWEDVDVQAGSWAALPIAAALGHTAVVQQLLQFLGERSPSFWVAVHSAFLDACRWGRADVLRLLLSKLPSYRDLQAAGQPCFDTATGRPYFLDVRVANDAALFHALCSGDSATVRCVLDAFQALDALPQVSAVTLASIYTPLGNACWPRTGGHRCSEQAEDTTHVQSMLGLLRAVLVSAANASPDFAFTYVLGVRSLVAAACAAGNTPLVLALLQTQAGPLHFHTPCLSLGWNGSLTATAPASSREAEGSPPQTAQSPHFSGADSVLAAACSSGNTLLVQALLAIHSPEQPTPVGRTSWSQGDLAQSSLQACQSDDLGILQLLIRWGDAFDVQAIPDQGHAHSCFVTACAHGSLRIVQFLQSIAAHEASHADAAVAAAVDHMPAGAMPWLQPLCCSCISRSLLEACLWGHEHVVRWLLRHRAALMERGADTPQPSNTGLSHASSSSAVLSNAGVLDALVVACTQGHTAVVQAFADMPSSSGVPPVDFAMSSDTLFVSACQAGRTGVARLLARLPVHSGAGVDLNTRDDKPFVEACSGGHLLLARWLLQQTGIRRVDPTVDDSAAFLGACRSGNLALVMLLAGLKGRNELDVATGKSFALVAAAEGNHAAVLCWLLAQRGARELDLTENNFRAVQAATRVGACDALQVMLAQSGARAVPPSMLNLAVLPCVGQEGHVEVLRVLLSLLPERGLDVHSQQDHFYITAYVNGCTELLSTLHTLVGQRWPSEAQLEAAAAGLDSGSGEEGGAGGARVRTHASRRLEDGSQSMQDSDSSLSSSSSD